MLSYQLLVPVLQLPEASAIIGLNTPLKSNIIHPTPPYDRTQRNYQH